MPANKNLYNDAMKKASNAAWDRKWEIAAREYRRALAEFPDDQPAHAGLAHVLKEGGKFEEALQEYQMLCKIQPGDPVPLAHTALLYEKLSRTEEATTTYVTLADMFLGQKQMNRAVEAWRRATALDPERIDVRERLIAAYQEAGHNSAAAQELTALAKIYQRRAEGGRAQSTAEQALMHDPENAQAKALLAELRGRVVQRTSEVGTDSPVEQARRSSLSRLAETVFDEGPRWRRAQAAASPPPAELDVEALLAKAIDAQTHGRMNEAVDYYEQVLKAGLTRAEIQFNLAFLYQSALRYDDAIALYKQTTGDEQYALASYMAMGQCYRAQGKVDLAVENLIQAMKIVDLSSVQHDQADEVIRLYESLAESYRAKGAQTHAENFMQSLVDFLSSKGWEDKVHEVRQHIEAVGESGTPLSLAEVLETPNADEVIETLRLSVQHLKEGHLVAANDEALHAVELAPNYLPAHVQIAEILTQAHRTLEAREKYEMLAEAASVRGDLPKAISFYRHALALAPEDVTRRAKLIDLLVRQGQLPEALNEYLELGTGLERAEENQKAIDRYAEALKLAQRAGVVSPAVTTLRNNLAEAYFKARDYKNALPLYKEIRASVPDDERARFILTELYLRVGQRDAGERELNELLARYANVPKRALAVLAALSRNLPYDVPVNIRLAKLLVQSGQRDKAIELLDGLGEHLLSAGQQEAAVHVIRELIALNPPQVADYRRFLDELSTPQS